jgi:hypothetical protein
MGKNWNARVADTALPRCDNPWQRNALSAAGTGELASIVISQPEQTRDRGCSYCGAHAPDSTGSGCSKCGAPYGS